jgi:nitrite reductase/ring-hydroxylating ferredoxin subunit/alkylhydroperoxidase/carboxymuconolactone decarboxylase family protein YurZ
MSKALDYLLKARPEAMEAYFTFLKKAGSHLDKKTAALISVITKVHAKTANGVRQYLPRALKAGASADEIIDALLFAMPALGFSKIVWAMDVILEMNLPEFDRVIGQLAADKPWVDLGEISEFKNQPATFVKKGSTACYVRIDGAEAIVYDAHCPHKGNLIPETALDGLNLACPFHEWKFDLTSGKCTHGGNTPLKRLEAKVEGGKVSIKA